MPSWNSVLQDQLTRLQTHSVLELVPIVTQHGDSYRYMQRDSVFEPFSTAIRGFWSQTHLVVRSILLERRTPGKAQVILGDWHGETVAAKVFDNHEATVYDGTDRGVTGDYACAREADAYRILQRENCKRRKCFPKYLGLYQTKLQTIQGQTYYAAVLLTEYFDGPSLEDLQDAPKMPKLIRRIILDQIMRAMFELFKRGVNHESILPRNVLVSTTSPTIKIIDFGNWGSSSKGIEAFNLQASELINNFDDFTWGMCGDELLETARNLVENEGCFSIADYTSGEGSVDAPSSSRISEDGE